MSFYKKTPVYEKDGNKPVYIYYERSGGSDDDCGRMEKLVFQREYYEDGLIHTVWSVMVSNDGGETWEETGETKETTVDAMTVTKAAYYNDGHSEIFHNQFQFVVYKKSVDYWTYSDDDNRIYNQNCQQLHTTGADYSSTDNWFAVSNDFDNDWTIRSTTQTMVGAINYDYLDLHDVDNPVFTNSNISGKSFTYLTNYIQDPGRPRLYYHGVENLSVDFINSKYMWSYNGKRYSLFLNKTAQPVLIIKDIVILSPITLIRPFMMSDQYAGRQILKMRAEEIINEGGTYYNNWMDMETLYVDGKLYVPMTTRQGEFHYGGPDSPCGSFETKDTGEFICESTE